MTVSPICPRRHRLGRDQGLTAIVVVRHPPPVARADDRVGGGQAACTEATVRQADLEVDALLRPIVQVGDARVHTGRHGKVRVVGRGG